MLLLFYKVDLSPLFAPPHRKPVVLNFFRLQDCCLSPALKQFLLLYVLDLLVHAFFILFLPALVVGKKSKLLVFVMLSVCD